MLNTAALQDELAGLLQAGHRAQPWTGGGVLVRALGASSARAYQEGVIQSLVATGRAVVCADDNGTHYAAL